MLCFSKVKGELCLVLQSWAVFLTMSTLKARSMFPHELGQMLLL